MGWCSGTDIFDRIAEKVLGSELPEKSQLEIIDTLVDALEDGDWDCQSDSDYFEHPIVQRVMREKHADWFEED